MSKKTNITQLVFLLFISVVVLFIASTVQPADKETAVSTPSSGLIITIEEMPETAVSQPVTIKPMTATPMTVEFVTVAPEPASKQPGTPERSAADANPELLGRRAPAKEPARTAGEGR